MKIKFIKPFRFIGNNPDDGSDDTVPVGHVVDLENDESTQWLIDNGFAKEVKEPEWVRKQIKKVHDKGIDINYRAIKAFYLPVGEWASDHEGAFRMEPGDVAGFAGYDEDVKGYLNQMVKLGYIEIEDNPNIVWEDGSE